MAKKNSTQAYKKAELCKLSRNHLISIILRQEKTIKETLAKISELEKDLSMGVFETIDENSPEVISVEEYLKYCTDEE